MRVVDMVTRTLVTQPAPPPVMIRVVFMQGQASTATWTTAGDVDVQLISGLPAGITIDGTSFSYDGLLLPDTYTTMVKVVTTQAPGIADWNGPMIQVNTTITIEFHVITVTANPFSSGIVDIVGLPSL